MGNFSLADLEYRFWTGLKNGTIGTVGAKGDPGGFTSGTVLGISNLNDIKTAGIYRQASGGDATAGRNYPSLREGILLVHEISGTGFLVQEYIPFTQETRVTYRREFFNPTWSSWRAFNSTRVAQTAGRAIYQWDDLNNREQLVYGDTGWRDISTSVIAPGTVGHIRIRRIGYQVYLHVFDWVPGTAPSICVVPTDFRADLHGYVTAMDANTGQTRSLFIDSTTGDLNRYGTWVDTNYHGTTLSWSTTKVWPAVLPGTAFGTIPNL